MKILAKIESLSFKCFICVWILHWFARICHECVLGWRYHSPGLPWNYDLHSSGEYAFFGVLGILLGWKYLNSQAAKVDAEHFNSLRQEIQRLCPIILIQRAIGLVLSSAVFILYSCLLMYDATDGLSKLGACIADKSHNYELAEQIFRIYSPPDPGRSFASWQTHFRPENEEVGGARNIAVAKVYGRNSLQLADRYKYIGATILLSTRYESSHLKEATMWLQKSLKLYGLLGANERSVDTLEQMAIIRCDQNDVTGLRDILLQASQLLDNHAKSTAPMVDRSLYACSLACLSQFAREAGDLRLAKIFLAKSLEVRKQSDDPSTHFWAILSFSALIAATLVSNVLPMRVGMSERLILLYQYNHAKRQLLGAGNLVTSIEALNTMITIDLYKGKFKQAWENSIHALRLTGIETKKMNPEFVECQVSFSAPMLIEAAHAVLFVALVFTGFFR